LISPLAIFGVSSAVADVGLVAVFAAVSSMIPPLSINQSSAPAVHRPGVASAAVATANCTPVMRQWALLAFF
jgi:hypothetical protein